MSQPVAYFITFTTYGAWLHGRDPGSVDREHNQYGAPLLDPDSDREQRRRSQLKHEPYVLDTARRRVVLSTIREVAKHRSWKLWAVHVRSNHVHIVVTSNEPPEKVMSDFKAWASRRLREQCNESKDRDRWTQHGSTKYLWNDKSLLAAIAYVIDDQGEPMEYYDSRSDKSEAEA